MTPDEVAPIPIEPESVEADWLAALRAYLGATAALDLVWETA